MTYTIHTHFPSGFNLSIVTTELQATFSIEKLNSILNPSSPEVNRLSSDNKKVVRRQTEMNIIRVKMDQPSK